MANTNRRKILRLGSASCAVPLFALLEVAGGPKAARAEDRSQGAAESETVDNQPKNNPGAAMRIHYLEIVSPDADDICKTYRALYGLQFGEPEANLGNARTANLPNGGMLGVRAPLRVTEEPVVRPYFLVEDIEASVAKAAESGAKIALPPMELPGHGKCAVFLQGGAQHGLWQL